MAKCTLVAVDQTNGGLSKDTSGNVLWLNLTLLAGLSNQASHTGQSRSDPPLRNHTQAPETEATYKLQVWPDSSNDEDATHLGQIFECIQKEWDAQVVDIRKTAAAEAEEAEKGDDGELDKDDNKQTKLKPK